MKNLIGEIVEFSITDTSGRKFQCKGMVNGRVRSHGGMQYLVKAWSVINAPEIAIRKVKKSGRKSRGGRSSILRGVKNAL